MTNYCILAANDSTLTVWLDEKENICFKVEGERQLIVGALQVEQNSFTAEDLQAVQQLAQRVAPEVAKAEARSELRQAFEADKKFNTASSLSSNSPFQCCSNPLWSH